MDYSSTFDVLPPEQNDFYKKEQKKNLSRIGYALLIYSLVAGILQTAFMTVCYYLFPSFYETECYQWILQIIPSYLIAFPLFCITLGGMPKKVPEKKAFSKENFIAFLAISFFLVLAGNAVALSLTSALEGLKGDEISNVVNTVMEKISPLLSFVLFVILAPIVEEIMFRKLLIDRLLPYSEWLAVAASAVIFGLVHGNFYQLFYAVLLGALFGVVYVKTGKLRYTILMHMIINFTGSIVASFFAEHTSEQASLATSINPWVFVAGIYSMASYLLAGCGIVFLIKKVKKLNLSKIGSRQLTLKTQFAVAFGNVGVLIFIAISAITFIFSIFM